MKTPNGRNGKPLKRRHRKILSELLKFGGTATTRQIAGALSLPVNGVSQSLGAPALETGRNAALGQCAIMTGKDAFAKI